MEAQEMKEEALPATAEQSVTEATMDNASRRRFFGHMGGLGAMAIASTAALPTSAEARHGGPDHHLPDKDLFHHPDCGGMTLGALEGKPRANAAFEIRVKAAKLARSIPIPPHPDNGDEQTLPDFIGNFSKGLPHNRFGEVKPRAYKALLRALETGKYTDFEQIPLGAPLPDRAKLINPEGGFAFDLEAVDAAQTFMPPAPRFRSPEEAGEMVELYWQSLTREVPFIEYPTNPLIAQAAEELSGLTDFRGPRMNGVVTPQTIFRVNFPGVLEGPYISQFLARPIPFGVFFISPFARVLLPGVNYMTDYDEWLRIQNGFPPAVAPAFDPVARLIRDGRDISSFVMVDVLYQAYFQALLILLATPPTGQSGEDPNFNGIGAPFNVGNPYNNSRTQVGFGTFGPEQILTMVAEVSTRALKAVWFQKWRVHRRLRPEAFGGRIQLLLTGQRDSPIDTDVLDSQALQMSLEQNGTYLLPQAFPQGSPVHPSYGAGHGTVAGACVTLLKAFFDENFIIQNPVQASADGLSVVPFDGPPLTLGGELNKVAANISIGRDFAGVHWRSDSVLSMLLGEQVAISLLREYRLTYNEPFNGFTFTTFSGKKITV